MLRQIHNPGKCRARAWILCFSLGMMSPVLADVQPVIEIEEIVTTYTAANNGAGPLWCYGSTVIARNGQDVYFSMIETGKDVPPLCNTRWQLWHRDTSGWKLEQSEQEYKQREPCPIALFDNGALFLSVNPSLHPPGVQYGTCQPLILAFDPKNLAAAPQVSTPVWTEKPQFTDHSYRGFAADGRNGELLLLNADNSIGAGPQMVSYRDKSGTWQAKGKITFPIRACYPQVALRDHAAHVMAIGDIVEPVEEWQELKFEKLKNKWDYVFRRLFYSYTPDISKTAFAEPIEVDTVEKTGGHISNLDLYLDEQGAAHLLYLKRPFQYEFLRDKYFPGQPMTVHLEYVIIRDGQIVTRRTLAESKPNSKGFNPGYARFHVTAEGDLYVVAYGSQVDTQGATISGNFLARVLQSEGQADFQPMAMKHPLGSYLTASPRAGTKPSNMIDLIGASTCDSGPCMRYARIQLRWD